MALSKISSLAKNATAYMAATMAPMVVNFLILPLYTRFMSPSDYGTLALISVFSALLLSVSGLQIASSLGRHYFDHDRENQCILFSSLLISVIGINLCMLLPLHVFGDTVSTWAFRGASVPYKPFLKLALILVFFNGITTCCVFMMRTEERGGTFLMISLCNTLIGVLFGIYFVVVRRLGAHGALLGMTCSASIYASMLLIANRRSLRFVYDIEKMKRALRFSIPLIPVTMGAIVFIYSDKYILSYFVSTSAIGLYDMANRIAVLIQVAGSSYKEAYSPVFMRHAIADRNHAREVLKGIITRFVVVCCLAILSVALFSEEIILLLLPKPYHGAYRFIPILLGAYFFHGMMTFPLIALRFVEKTKILSIGTIVPGLVNVAANILLIPKFGIIVAAWTTLVSYLLNFVILLMFSNRYYRLIFEWRKLLSVGALTIALFGSVMLFKGESVGLNVLMKLSAVCMYVGVLKVTNVGSVFSDAMLIVKRVLVWRK